MRTTPTLLASLAIASLVACTPTTPQEGDDLHTSIMIGWLIEDTTVAEDGMTTSHVSLTIADDGRTKEVLLGDYVGCTQETIPEDGPFLTLKCWWAGGGDEFQVRMEGTNTLSIDHRMLDEMVDIPEFTQLKTVTIPDGVMVMPVPMKHI